MPVPAAPASAFDFRLVFAALPAPHALLGADGQVQAFSDAFLDLLPGPVAAGLPGQPLAALLAACEAAGLRLAPGPGWPAALARARAGGLSQTLRPALQAGAPAETRYWQGTLQPMPGHRPPPHGVLLRLLDVTDQLHLEADPLHGRARLQALTRHLPQQVWTADASGRPEFFNERTAAFLGEALSRRARHNWRQAIHPDDRAAVLARWRQAVAQGAPYEAELRLLRSDGAYRWMLAQAQPAHDAQGQVLRWYGTNTDIHELHTLTHQLVRREQVFRFLAESLPHLVWAADATGRLTFVNQRWVDYTGLPLAEAQQSDWTLMLPPEDRAAAAHELAAYLASGQEFERRTRLREARTGTYRWFLHRARAVYDEQGRLLHWYGTSTDVDDSARTQALLEDQNQRLVRANQDFDNFVYAASHDLKQPINNMAGIFEELTRTAYFRDPDAVKLIDYFERALGQIYSTIDDLTAVVQLQRPEPAAPERLPLEPLVHEVLHSLHNQVARLRADVRLDFAPLPAVRYVRVHLQSILFNLLSNALKYAAPGRPPRIGLRAAPDPATGRPVLTVQDNGLGIDLDRFGPQLFQQFARFHAHIDGTGTGLYLVNRIVQSHGGHLEVASVVDSGTTFTIYL